MRCLRRLQLPCPPLILNLFLPSLRVKSSAHLVPPRSFCLSKPRVAPIIIPAHSSCFIDMSESSPASPGTPPVIRLNPTESALFRQLREFLAHKNSSGEFSFLHVSISVWFSSCLIVFVRYVKRFSPLYSFLSMRDLQEALPAQCACVAGGCETSCCTRTTTTSTYA
jgi:hypothetical protein